MERLAGFVQHVVGDIDDVIDRALTSGLDGVLEPTRTGAYLDPLNADCSIVRAGLGGADLDTTDERLASRFVFRAGFDIGVFHIDAKLSGQLAGDADVAQHVDTVGRDLEVEDRVAVGEESVQRRAERGVRLEDHDAVVVLANLKFLGGAHHTLGWLAPQLGGFDLEIAGEDGAGQRDHDLITLGEVPGTADDVVDYALFARGHLTAAQAVGVRVLDVFKDFADDDVVELGRSQLLVFFDIKAKQRQDFSQHFG